MRRALIASTLAGVLTALGTLGVACTKVVVVAGDPATAEAPVELDGDPMDIALACEGRGAASVEFAATMGKGRAKVACRAASAVATDVDAGVPPPDAAPEADAAPIAAPERSTVTGAISPDATNRLPGRPMPAGCAARYGGRRGRPDGCPDCSPRLITTVDLACTATTIRIEADGEAFTATCAQLACPACQQRVLAFIGAGAAAAAASCVDTPATGP